ncbi:MAG: zinc ribbon domain-containing protein [Coriobacteriales bacterium]|nr:zinc ribbon domain-containing protein [Coriobacteriales bacterium]
MYCHKCGLEVREGAQFCPKCGTKLMDAQRPKEPPNRLGAPSKPLDDIAKVVNVGTIHVVEGVLSVILAALALFAPVVRVDYGIDCSNSSMLHVVLNLSSFSYLDNYAWIGPTLGIFMVLVCIGSLLNAKQAFSNELPKAREIVSGIKVSNSYASLITLYAITLIILLGIAKDKTFGIVGCSGWAWLLLLGGISCQVVHFIRWYLNVPRAS